MVKFFEHQGQFFNADRIARIDCRQDTIVIIHWISEKNLACELSFRPDEWQRIKKEIGLL